MHEYKPSMILVMMMVVSVMVVTEEKKVASGEILLCLYIIHFLYL